MVDDDMAALAPPSLKACTTVKFNAGQFVSKRKDKLEKYYTLGGLLGEGGYGQVYKAKQKTTFSERAVKVIEKTRINKEENDQLIKEFDIVKELDHPNILKMYEMYEDMDNYYIVTDIYKGGELFDEIDENGNFAEDDAAILLINVLSCVNYCHSKNLLHRDLKPENILLTQGKKLDDIKIIDFGLASYIKEGERLKPSVGSSYYKAPEVLEGDYGKKCDVWSVGVIAFIILAGYAPFDGDDDAQIEDAIIQGEFDFDDPVWDQISEECKDFIEEMLTYDEKERPTAAEALTHPWLEEAKQWSADEYRKRDSNSMKNSLNNLAKFHAQSKLKQATCAFIASQLLLKEEKAEIDEVFRALDTNNDGKLTPDEIKSGYSEFYGKPLSDEEVNEIFKRVNFRGTGAIDYSEFVVASMFEKNLLDDTRLTAAFKMFDKDGDGYIDADNLKEVLSSFGEQEGNIDDYINNKIIKEFDTDGDGLISFADFKQMMFQTVKTEQRKGRRSLVSLRDSMRKSFAIAVDAGSLGMEDLDISEKPEDVSEAGGKLSPKLSPTQKKGFRSSIKDIRGASGCMSIFDHAAKKDSGVTQRIVRPKKKNLPSRTTTREVVHLDESRTNETMPEKKKPSSLGGLIDEEDEDSD